MIDYINKYDRYLSTFNDFLNKKFNALSGESPSTIKDAMRYAILDGGKRIRPVLCLSIAEMFNIPLDKVLNYALAIECIHSYSLVHDDLPCMDNDDFRRGKLSTHKKFGEAIGVLAGDALLNFAFEVCLSCDEMTKADVKAMRIIAELAGYNGMIAGQVLDLENEQSKNISKQILYDIYINKTAKLILAPILVVSCFVEEKYHDALTDYGLNLGILFQISDDILDVEGDISTIGKTPQKDAKSGKLTAVKLFGLDGAKNILNVHYEKCVSALSKLPNNDFLKAFTEKMHNRKK